MKLKYRGVSYDYTPPVVERFETQITATYRGVSYPLQDWRAKNVPQSSLNLKYRGVPYQTNMFTPDEVDQYVAAHPEVVSGIGEAIAIEERLRLKYQFHHPVEPR
ncbi:MAG: DUF4278 domain-containing protein [Elainellaceae cyanobacterium]